MARTKQAKTVSWFCRHCTSGRHGTVYARASVSSPPHCESCGRVMETDHHIRDLGPSSSARESAAQPAHTTPEPSTDGTLLAVVSQRLRTLELEVREQRELIVRLSALVDRMARRDASRGLGEPPDLDN